MGKSAKANETAKEHQEEVTNTVNEEETQSPEQETKELDEVTKLQEELSAQKEGYLRLAAEYENYRKRTQAEKALIFSDAIVKTITELLPVADSLDSALQSMADAPEEFTKGLELVRNQLQTTFEKLNVEPFGEVGDEFDPELHNAISKTENDALEENTLSQIFQKGYKTGDKIIRHAMVQVAN